MKTFAFLLMVLTATAAVAESPFKPVPDGPSNADIMAEVQGLRSDVSALSAGQQQFQSDLAKVREDVSKLREKLSDLELKVDKIEGRQTAIKDWRTDYENRLKFAEEAIDHKATVKQATSRAGYPSTVKKDEQGRTVHPPGDGVLIVPRDAPHDPSYIPSTIQGATRVVPQSSVRYVQAPVRYAAPRMMPRTVIGGGMMRRMFSGAACSS